MKTSSAKAKGRRAAQEVKDQLLAGALLCYHGEEKLEDGDIVVTSSGDTGEDLKLSPAARRIYPVQIEVKNQEKLQIWAALKQAETHGQYMSVLAFTRNRSDMYAAIKFSDLVTLLVNQK